ncbi:hypothetical protein BH09VER1_BH09VER1_05720 [soil metagenome]
MKSSIGFHPEALKEFHASAIYYSTEVSANVAQAFITTIEGSTESIAKASQRWPIVRKPDIRRYICRRFPFVIYYRVEREDVTIYAVMHSSRRPEYWIGRLS